MPTILAFVAHPDDETYPFGGTLALAARAGWRCAVYAATAGEGGERHDGGAPGREALAEARLRELGASCRALGAEPPVCWNLPDGGLSQIASQTDRAVDAIREHRPDVVLSLGRDGAYGHPDHLAVFRWVTDAVAAADEAPALLLAAFPTGLFLPQYELCRVAGVLGDPPVLDPRSLGGGQVHYSVPIGATAGQKLASIAAHRTQLPDGDPRSLFPPGIIDDLLSIERFADASGRANRRIRRLLAQLA